jgi:release factor glutamine methyltransferase
MTTREAEKSLIDSLKPFYSDGEAQSISAMVIDHITGKNHSQRIAANTRHLTDDENKKLTQIRERLLLQEPIQYILQEAWFYNLKFYVDPAVLIPRPETEELVKWILDDVKLPFERLRILDIGSGSGCIPIALKYHLPGAEVWGCDISDDALLVARRNADALGTAVDFVQLDFLDDGQRKQLPIVDIIISNPPYVPKRERESLAPNVREHEPEQALFVTDDDPLIFYKALAAFGKEHLSKQGLIYCEIHENAGEAVVSLFHAAGYCTEMKRDMQGKERLVKVDR